MGRNNIHFESRLEKLARVLTKRLNVNVVIQGNLAYTDGKTIYLPMLEEVDSELATDLECYLDHEASHIKFTDFEAWLANRAFKGEFHRHLTNAIEDSRIEILMVKEYPGTAFTLDRLNEKFAIGVNKQREKLPWPIRLILGIRDVYDNKPPRTDTQIEPLMAAILADAKQLKSKCRNTKDVIKLTGEIIDKVNLAREALNDGENPLSDKEMEEAMKQLEEMRGGEPPVELNKDRKKGEKKQSKGLESLDPATEYDYGDDGESEDEDGDKSADSESGDQSDSEGSGADGEDSEGSKGKDGDSEKSDGKSSKGSDYESDETKENHEDSADTKNKNINTHESTSDKITGEEELESRESKNQKRQQFDGSQEINAEKNTSKGWKEYVEDWSESDLEKSLAEEEVKANESDSGFTEFGFNAESYMKAVLEDALVKETKIEQNRGYYYGKQDVINPKHVSLPYSRQYDEVIDYSGKGSVKDYNARKLEVMHLIRPIKEKFERVLKVKENAKLSPERERGRLNTRTLAKLCIDPEYKTPFTMFSRTETKNVAVTMLIDCSGSMSGNPMEVARQTAVGLGEALKALDIKFEVLGFNTSSNSTLASEVRSLTSEDKKRFNRFGETLRLMVFKSFDQPNLTGINEARSGGANADGESVIWAAKRLVLRREKRKILIVLSDGQPSYGDCNHEVLAGDLKRVVAALPKAGIEAIGIGICTDDPKLFYDNWAMVSDIKELPTTVMNKVSKIIIDGLK